MKKIVAAAIVVALLLAAPFLMGEVARNRLDKAFEALPEDAPYLKVVENKWTRGWLHSTAPDRVRAGVAAAGWRGDRMGDAGIEAAALHDAGRRVAWSLPRRFEAWALRGWIRNWFSAMR